MSKKPTPENIALDIIRVSRETGVPVCKLTPAKYKEEGAFTAEEIKKNGGFSNIVTAYLTSPQPTIQYSRKIKAAYIRRLEAKVSSQEYLVEQLINSVKEEIKKNPIKINRYHAPKVKRKTDPKRELVIVISDTHFGLDISIKENGINAYNWTVAANRMAEYALAIKQIAEDIKIDKAHICIGGDIAQGVVYTTDKGTHALITQILGSMHILANFIEFCASVFSEITVHCTPDNHMRQPSKKRDGLISQKWDSYSTILHVLLHTHFRNTSRISFNVPLTPYTLVKIFDFTFLLTHGDTVLNIPFPTKILPIEKITSEMSRLVSSGITDKLDGVIIGHLHTPLSMPLNNGGHLIINGTASGTDNYSLSRGYLYNNPTQVAFLVNKNTGIEAVYTVKLNPLNNPKKTLNEIIPPFKATVIGPESIVL